MKIKAAVCREKDAPLTMEEIELDDPRPDEVLVKVKYCGICHTDICMQDQSIPVPLPAVLGHEGCGIIEQVGADVRGFKPGDPVLMCFDACGECIACRSGSPSFCDLSMPLSFGGHRMDGSTTMRKGKEIIHGSIFGQSSFATYSLATARNLIKLDSEEGMEYFGPLGCGLQTGAGAVINAMRLGMGQTIVIFGVGSVGLSAVMAAKLVGASIIVAVDLNDEKLKMAKELGATHAFNPKSVPDIIKAIRETTGGFGLQFSLDTTGLPQVVRQGVEVLAVQGKCAILGASPMDVEVHLPQMHMMVTGKHLFGTVEGNSVPQDFIPKLIDQYRKGNFPIDKLAHFYSFDDINQALEDSGKGKIIKGIVKM